MPATVDKALWRETPNPQDGVPFQFGNAFRTGLLVLHIPQGTNLLNGPYVRRCCRERNQFGQRLRLVVTSCCLVALAALLPECV